MSRLHFAMLLMLCAVAASPAASRAQDNGAGTGLGPVPPGIHAAHKIFVSNAGADSGLFPSPFSGDPDRAYNQLYAGLKAWGQYQLVSGPAQADLVLEIQVTAPNGPTNGSKQNGASDPVPMMRLVIYDENTHFVLWTITRSIQVALLQKTHDRNFDDALTSILVQFEALSGKGR